MMMAYDESYVGSDPGPVASYNWVERSIIRALTEGVEPNKIVLGIAQYGRYWKDGEKVGGYGISNRDVENLIAQYNGTVLFDQESLSPMARITIGEKDPKPVINGQTLSAGTYTIWYENAQSINYKLSLVKKYSLKGVGNWNIVQGTEGIWNHYALGLPESVPVSAPLPPEVDETPVFETYSVVSGDSLSKIAKMFGTTVESIKELNHLTSDMIFVGQTLLIPSDGQVPEEEPGMEETEKMEEVVAPPEVAQEEADLGTVPEEKDPLEAPAPERENIGTSTYIVSPGDSLYLIAKRFNATIPALKAANNLTGDTIYVGQKLIIPGTTVEQTKENPAITYTVASGDTLSGIAKKYNTTVQAIKQINQLTSDFIRIGHVIKIPK